MSVTLFRTSAAQLTAEELSHIRQEMLPRIMSGSATGTSTEANDAAVSDESDESDESNDPDDAESSAESSADGRHRTHIEREWPPVGTKLIASYFGTDYTATIIPASKKLKSGKQIRIETGPMAGTICDSYSEAMIVATEAQRERENLGRKGASNGWTFWNPA